MKLKLEYTKDEYISELMALWKDAVIKVYRKDPIASEEEIALPAWEGTNMTPLQYVIFVADPKNITNMINRGQKVREKRWLVWLKEHGVN